MPRIAPRTEPYDNPSRQQRHYKAKRDQVLNILARASHVSRCNFALLFVNARGQADCYSSKLFAPKLDKWFNDQVVKEAVELTRNHVLQQAASQSKESDSIPEDQLDDDPLSFINPTYTQSQAGVPSANTTSHEAEDTDTSEPFPAHALHFLTPTGVSDSYYNDVFQRMQQNAAKIIAKCWIKIIEPKKQSRHPYREAEGSRPAWWPVGIRHKEPDHLLAKERQGLLVGILRAGVIPIKELEKKTFETIRDLSEDRLAMLRELFVVAKEDDRRREAAGKFADALFPSPNGSHLNGGGPVQERQSSEPSMSTISDKSPLDSFMAGAESFQATPPTSGFDFQMQDLSPTHKLLETPPAPDWTTHPRDQVDLSHPFSSMGGAAAALNKSATAPELQTSFPFASSPMGHLNIPLQLSPQRATSTSPLHHPIDQSRSGSIADGSPVSTSSQGFPPQARLMHQAHQPRAASRSYHTSQDMSGARRSILGESVPMDPHTLAAMTARSPNRQPQPQRTPGAMRRQNRPGFLQLPERPTPAAVSDPSLLPLASATSAGTPAGGYVFTPDTCTPMTAQLEGGYFDLPTTGWAGSPLVYRQSSQGVVPLTHFTASLMSFDSNPPTPLDMNAAGSMRAGGSYFQPTLPGTSAQVQGVMLQDIQHQPMPGGFDFDGHGQLAEKMQQMNYGGSHFSEASVASSRSASAEAQAQLNVSYGNMAMLQAPAELNSSDSDSRGMSSDGEGQSTSQFF
ncbi:hypothetical protein FRC04_008172 [Tulasnella sp. 424]|nr:hypothetical protein FRC04_008172 [Tulasnella sp. 424]KAG8974456.1 hypothetical protein FRC05_007255 [Tulasnella sp. 425]